MRTGSLGIAVVFEGNCVAISLENHAESQRPKVIPMLEYEKKVA
jgi:hypothetical protein